METIKSKIGIIKQTDEKVFGFLSDFRNFSKFIPSDKINNWSATSDTCHFNIMGIGQAGLIILEKSPNKLIKISSHENTVVKFLLWININRVDETSSEIHITIQPDVNPVMMTLIKSQLKSFADLLITQIEKISF